MNNNNISTITMQANNDKELIDMSDIQIRHGNNKNRRKERSDTSQIVSPKEIEKRSRLAPTSACAARGDSCLQSDRSDENMIKPINMCKYESSHEDEGYMCVDESDCAAPLCAAAKDFDLRGRSCLQPERSDTAQETGKDILDSFATFHKTLLSNITSSFVNSSNITTDESPTSNTTSEKEQERLDIYNKVVRSTNARYIVKLIYDKEIDIRISDTKYRNIVLQSNPHLVNITHVDDMYKTLLHDLYINFFYVTYCRHRKDKDIRTMRTKYKEICASEEFKNVLFALLGVEDQLDLQERYLHHVYNDMTRKFNITLSSIDRFIASNKSEWEDQNEDILKQIAQNYIEVFKLGRYKQIVKYVNGNATNIYISNPDVRKHIVAILNQMKECSDTTNGDPTAHEARRHLLDVKCIFNFEENAVPTIAQILIDNYIEGKVSRNSIKKCKNECERIIYQNQDCLKTIQSGLGELANSYSDYINIIVNQIITILVSRNIPTGTNNTHPAYTPTGKSN